MRLRSIAVLAAVCALLGCDDTLVTDPSAPHVLPDDALPVGLVDDDGVAAPPRCAALPPADDPLDVQTTFATLRGVADDDGGGFSWKAIRFAAPPTGALRFHKPAAPACEPAVVDAGNDPPQCLQLGLDTDIVSGNEDCLFLNVFRPERQPGDPAQLPVLFWIHGGAQLLGSGHQATGFGNLYDGTALARESRAIVVSINYRLGALGFLAHPALEDTAGVVGNWAHHDILSALHWTNDNIAAFGGDPAHITIFGESAGAHNVCVMIASPLARGLFSGAIAESGGCEVAPLEVREAQGEDTAAAVGCAGEDVADCLRHVDAEAFVRSIAPVPPLVHVWWLPWGSTVDGEVLTDQPLDVIRRGEHNAVPTIVGSNREETNLFLGADVPLTCFDLRLQFEVLMSSSFATTALRDAAIDDILDTYDCSRRLITRDVLIEASTDLEFTCQARRLTRALQTTALAPVWRYHFRDRANVGVYAAMGAFHAWELAYVFGSFETLLYVPSPGERALSGVMQRAWGRFAAVGDPNHLDAPTTWLTADNDRTIAFDEDPFAAFGGAVDITMIDDPAPACDLWDRLTP